eukprot:1156723-Pelagomonas_calceolata.AAC.4
MPRPRVRAAARSEAARLTRAESIFSSALKLWVGPPRWVRMRAATQCFAPSCRAAHAIWRGRRKQTGMLGSLQGGYACGQPSTALCALLQGCPRHLEVQKKEEPMQGSCRVGAQ